MKAIQRTALRGIAFGLTLLLFFSVYQIKLFADEPEDALVQQETAHGTDVEDSPHTNETSASEEGAETSADILVGGAIPSPNIEPGSASDDSAIPTLRRRGAKAGSSLAVHTTLPGDWDIPELTIHDCCTYPGCRLCHCTSPCRCSYCQPHRDACGCGCDCGEPCSADAPCCERCTCYTPEPPACECGCDCGEPCSADAPCCERCTCYTPEPPACECGCDCGEPCSADATCCERCTCYTPGPPACECGCGCGEPCSAEQPCGCGNCTCGSSEIPGPTRPPTGGGSSGGSSTPDTTPPRQPVPNTAVDAPSGQLEASSDVEATEPFLPIPSAQPIETYLLPATTDSPEESETADPTAPEIQQPEPDVFVGETMPVSESPAFSGEAGTQLPSTFTSTEDSPLISSPTVQVTTRSAGPTSSTVMMGAGIAIAAGGLLQPLFSRLRLRRSIRAAQHLWK